MKSNRAIALLTVGIASLALAGCSLLGGTPAPSATPTDSSGGTETDVFTVVVGDCLNDVAEGEASTATTIDCADPHDYEAYAAITLDDGDFPGTDEVQKSAIDGCKDALSTFVGIDYSASMFSYSFYYPTEDSWAQGDREILCLIYDPAGQTTGSLAGAAK